MGRSRSPPRKTEWISRAIAAFGRYPERRPPGLEVDSTGTFLLDDLIRVWGRHQNLGKEDIMHAVRRHMYHDGGSDANGALRFAVDADLDNNIIIRVIPKPGRLNGAHAASATSSRAQQSGHGRQRHRGGGGICVEASTDSGGLAGSVFAITKQEKLAMSLDEIVHVERADPTSMGMQTSASASSTPYREDRRQRVAQTARSLGTSASAVAPPCDEERRQRVLGKCEQMGLTKDTMHRRLPPKMRGAFEESRYSENSDKGRGHNGKGGGKSEAEKVQRWIAWVLKKGFALLGITVVDGWVNLAELAVVMGQQRPRFGQFDADKLILFLKETDIEGRFEVANGRLRKVEKELRQPQATKLPSASIVKGTIRVNSSDSSRSDYHRKTDDRRLNRSRSNSPVYIDDDDDDDLAATCNRALNVNSGAEGAERLAASRPPRAPPGDGWTMYQDDGTQWWYYEGPLGKWWCASVADTPQPYED